MKSQNLILKSRRYCRKVLPLLGAAAAIMAVGCRTRLIDTTIVNQGSPIQLLEFDYPSASFGVDSLPAGGHYHYRFRVQGSGQLALHYQDSAGHSHTVQGPTLEQGQEGALTVTVGAPNMPVRWDLKLNTPK